MINKVFHKKLLLFFLDTTTSREHWPLAVNPLKLKNVPKSARLKLVALPVLFARKQLKCLSPTPSWRPSDGCYFPRNSLPFVEAVARCFGNYSVLLVAPFTLVISIIVTCFLPFESVFKQNICILNNATQFSSLVWGPWCFSSRRVW